MPKIIKLTEGQLKKIVKNIIGEQSVPTFQQQMGTAPKVDISCIGLVSPQTFKEVIGFNKETIRFYNNARFADENGQKGSYVCNTTQKGIVNLVYDSDPKAIKYYNLAKAPEEQPKKTVFVANEKLPLKFGQKGENIKLLQNQLGVKPETGQFWTKTEAAIKAKAPEYKRAEGVTEAIWNKIFPQGRKIEQPIALQKTNVPTNLSAPTTLPTNVPSVPSIQPAG
jgi:hypothetical protein